MESEPYETAAFLAGFVGGLALSLERGHRSVENIAKDVRAVERALDTLGDRLREQYVNARVRADREGE